MEESKTEEEEYGGNYKQVCTSLIFVQSKCLVWYHYSGAGQEQWMNGNVMLSRFYNQLT